MMKKHKKTQWTVLTISIFLIFACVLIFGQCNNVEEASSAQKQNELSVMESSFVEVSSSINSSVSLENDIESFITDLSDDSLLGEEPDVSDELLDSSDEESDSSEDISEVLNGSDISEEESTPPDTSEEEPDISDTSDNSEPEGPPAHVHEWEEATCTAAKTCASCGATEGSASGHDWKASTCTSAKTCKTCGATEGSAKGHDWKDATCTSAKTCQACGKTEGSAAGHSWKEATCTSAKTCRTCGKTEGTAKGHSYNKGSCTACGAKDPNYEENVVYGDSPVVIEVNGVEYSLTSYADAEAVLPLKTEADFVSPEKGFAIYVKSGAVMAGYTYTANGDGTYICSDGNTRSDNQLTGVFRNLWCRTCSKRAGDGTCGTCVKYLHDDECDECGEAVEGMKCHTCKEN